jgi:predicted lipase
LGHSLGGVLANLAAIDFVLADAWVSVITFGTPRFANLEFVNWLNSIPFRILDCYVTQGDIVPNLPTYQKSISGGTISNCIVDETKDDPKICLGQRMGVWLE